MGPTYPGRPSAMCTVGVEEEYHLVDAGSFALRGVEEVVAQAKATMADAESEISTSQLEVATPVCTTLEEVRAELVRLRCEARDVAARSGCRILAMGTHPFSSWKDQRLSDGPRYVGLFQRWGLLALQQLITGCHVHVSVDDPDLRIAVLDRVRPWLPVLLAITASSPFWEGVDTGYASYRTMWFDRWPTAGMPPALGDAGGFDAVVADLVRAGAIDDATHLYWDVRPSARYPTLEFRVADVCPSVDDAVLYAALARALVRTFAASPASPVPDLTDSVLRVARWRAARHGLTDDLVHPATGDPRPAGEVVDALLALVRDDLEANDEWAEVAESMERLRSDGTAASRYRTLMERTGDLRAVTAAAVD